MRIVASADEERSKGQGRSAEELVEAVAQIDGGELGRQARQQPPGAAGAREVQAKGADQLAVDRLDDLTPMPVLAAGRGGGRARIVLGCGQGRPIVLPPMLLPPPAPEALISFLFDR